MSSRLDPDEFRLQGRLKEMAEHVRKLEEFFHGRKIDECDEEIATIRAVLDGIWAGR